MKQLGKSDAKDQKEYRKLKKYWKTILKKNLKLNYTTFKQFPLFQQKYLTETDVLDYLLSIDESLRQSYNIYQDLLTFFDAKDFTDFFGLIDSLPHTLDAEFKKSIRYLKKYKKSIEHALKYPYLNGKLEKKTILSK